jgi:hypothetical protein
MGRRSISSKRVLNGEPAIGPEANNYLFDRVRLLSYWRLSPYQDHPNVPEENKARFGEYCAALLLRTIELGD